MMEEEDWEAVEYCIGEISTHAEMKRMYALLKAHSNKMSQQMKYRLQVGQTVSFISRGGNTVSGVLTKKMQKKALVEVGATTWTVPMQMLTIEDDEDAGTV